MPKIHSRPYRPNPEVCCERCCFGTGKHADFCHGPYKAPFTIFGMEVWIDPGMPKEEMAMLSFAHPDSSVSIRDLKVGMRASTSKADLLMPKNMKEVPGSLRIARIDYENKTVTLTGDPK